MSLPNVLTPLIRCAETTNELALCSITWHNWACTRDESSGLKLLIMNITSWIQILTVLFNLLQSPCSSNSTVQINHSLVSNSVSPGAAEHQISLFITRSRSWLKLSSSSWGSHPTVSSCLQAFPASGSFPVSQFFPLCGQSIGASSISVLPINIQDDFF